MTGTTVPPHEPAGLGGCSEAVWLPPVLMKRAISFLVTDGHGHHFGVVNEGQSLICSSMGMKCLEDAGMLGTDNFSDVQNVLKRKAIRTAILEKSDLTEKHEALVEFVQRGVSYKDGYRLLAEKDKKDPKGRRYFQVECDRPDIYTREMGVGRGGKVYLSVHMNESELVRLAFGLFRAYEEHEVREWFQYNGRSVMGPHIDIDALWEAAGTLDFRAPEDPR